MAGSADNDPVILVDADDVQVGTAGKLDAHQRGLKHRAISVLVRNGSGKFLLQRRNPAKYHSGGLWTNACCSHPLPGESAESVAAELAAMLHELSAHDAHFSAAAELTLFRPPLETSLDQPIVVALAHAGQQLLGQALPITGATFWMDAALLGAAGIPTAIFGPRGAGLHADVEWVDLASVQACADVLVAAARSFCG